jgi:hypothetical protein
LNTEIAIGSSYTYVVGPALRAQLALNDGQPGAVAVEARAFGGLQLEQFDNAHRFTRRGDQLQLPARRGEHQAGRQAEHGRHRPDGGWRAPPGPRCGERGTGRKGRDPRGRRDALDAERDPGSGPDDERNGEDDGVREERRRDGHVA